MMTFNAYGQILMLIQDLEEPEGVKEVVQPGDEEFSRDIERVLTVLKEIKEN